MGCYNGFHSKGGAQGVGAATTNAVVSSSILILAANYLLTSILFTASDGDGNPKNRTARRQETVRLQGRSRWCRSGHRQGESLVVIGGSGTGKSVTIKSVLGILRPDEGQIFVDGEEVTHFGGRARDRVLRQFGMLFQGAALFDSLTVWENVAFGLIQGRGMARKQAKDIAIAKTRQGRPRRRSRQPVAVRTLRRNAEARRPRSRHRGGSRNHLLRRGRPPASIPSWPTSSTT